MTNLGGPCAAAGKVPWTQQVGTGLGDSGPGLPSSVCGWAGDTSLRKGLIQNTLGENPAG